MHSPFLAENFIVYLYGKITYSGRAKSILPDGRYLIIKKSDGSVTVHANNHTKPRNYISSNATTTIEKGKMIFYRKGETLTIEHSDIIWYRHLDGWSDAELSISMTESELVNKLIANWGDYIKCTLAIFQKEYRTEHGPIDIVGKDVNGHYHIVEVKRKRATVTNVTQLKKYFDTFEDAVVYAYLASPDISVKALAYLNKLNMMWVKIDF